MPLLSRAYLCQCEWLVWVSGVCWVTIKSISTPVVSKWTARMECKDKESSCCLFLSKSTANNAASSKCTQPLYTKHWVYFKDPERDRTDRFMVERKPLTQSLMLPDSQADTQFPEKKEAICPKRSWTTLPASCNTFYVYTQIDQVLFHAQTHIQTLQCPWAMCFCLLSELDCCIRVTVEILFTDGS